MEKLPKEEVFPTSKGRGRNYFTHPTKNPNLDGGKNKLGNPHTAIPLGSGGELLKPEKPMTLKEFDDLPDD